MGDSIFDKLLKAHRNSDEDYLTELFAFILEHIEGMGNKYIQFLCENCKQEKILLNNVDIEKESYVETQKRVPNGIIDLILKKGNDVVFICEHKWLGGELSYKQIAKYMECAGELGAKKAYSVLITPSRTQWTQKADIQLTWSDIYEFITTNINEYQNPEKFILEQFIIFLKNNGLGKYDAIKPEALCGYFDAMNLENALKEIFNDLSKNLSKNCNWLQDCSGLQELTKWNDSDLNIHMRIDRCGRVKYGRLGIDFMKEWKPGLFAGVILDPSDHKIEPNNRQKGPDFVVILDVENNDQSIYHSVLNSDKYKKLSTKLSENSGTFTFLPHDKLKNKWRLAVLKKPLFDILISKYSYEEQVEAIKRAIIDGIELMLNN